MATEVTEIAVRDRRAVQDVSAVAPAAQPSPAEGFMLALRSGATPDQAERVGEMLLRFQREEAARDAERAFNSDFAKAMQDMPAIPKDAVANRVSKDGRNAGTFHYAKLESILGKTQPVLGRHGFHLGFSVSNSDRGITVAAVVRHQQGHSIREELSSPVMQFGPANTALQNLEGTVTALKRTLSMSILGLAVGGEEEVNPYIEPAPAINADLVEPFMMRIHDAARHEELQPIFNQAKQELKGADYVAVRTAVWQRKAEIEEAAK